MPKQSAADCYLLGWNHQFSAQRYVYNAGSPFLSDTDRDDEGEKEKFVSVLRSIFIHTAFCNTRTL